MGKVSAAYTVSHFQILEDVSGYTPLAAEDTSIGFDPANAPPSGYFRVRLCIQETNGGAENNVGFQWQYSLNGGTWTNVSTTSSVIRTVNSTWITDAADITTSQLSGSGTFITDNDGYTETGTITGVADFAGNDYTETEAALQLQLGDISVTDDIQLRVTIGGNAPAGTPVLPTITYLQSRTVTQTATETLDITASQARIQIPIRLRITTAGAGSGVVYGYAGANNVYDSGSLFTDDANFADGDVGTFAYQSADGANNLFLEGFAPYSGENTSQVVAHVNTRLSYALDSTVNGYWQFNGFYPIGGGNNFVNLPNTSGVQTWTDWLNNDSNINYFVVSGSSQGYNASASEHPWPLISRFETTGADPTEVGGYVNPISAGNWTSAKYYAEQVAFHVGEVTKDFGEQHSTYPLDKDSYWNDESNALDGSTSTFAYPNGSTGNITGNTNCLVFGIESGLEALPPNSRVCGVAYRVYGQEYASGIYRSATDTIEVGGVDNLVATAQLSAWCNAPSLGYGAWWQGTEAEDLEDWKNIQIRIVSTDAANCRIYYVEYAILYHVSGSGTVITFTGTSYLNVNGSTQNLDITTSTATVEGPSATARTVNGVTEALDITNTNAVISASFVLSANTWDKSVKKYKGLNTYLYDIDGHLYSNASPFVDNDPTTFQTTDPRVTGINAPQDLDVTIVDTRLRVLVDAANSASVRSESIYDDPSSFDYADGRYPNPFGQVNAYYTIPATSGAEWVSLPLDAHHRADSSLATSQPWGFENGGWRGLQFSFLKGISLCYWYHAEVLLIEGLSSTGYFNGTVTSGTESDPATVQSYTRSSGSGTTVTFTAPSGIESGDLLVIVAGQDGPNLDPPELSTSATGWTKLTEDGSSGTDVILAIFWKVATGAEGNVAIDSATSTSFGGYYFRINGADPADPINTYATQEYASTETPLLPSITTDEDGCLLLGGFITDDGSGVLRILNTGWGDYIQLQPGSGTYDMITGLAQQVTAGSTGTVYADHSEIGAVGAVSFQLGINRDTGGTGSSFATPSNAADGSTATYATTTVDGATLSITGNNISVNADIDEITYVFIRVYHKAWWTIDPEGHAIDVDVYTQGQGELLDTIQLGRAQSIRPEYPYPYDQITSNTGHVWPNWVYVPPPAGGWTWSAIQNLELYFYVTNTELDQGGGIAKAEIIVLGTPFIDAPGRAGSTVRKNVKIRCNEELLEITNTNAIVQTSINKNVNCTTEVLTLANTHASVFLDLSFTTDTLVLTLTDNDATIHTDLIVAGSTQSLTLTNTNATVNRTRGVICQTEELTITVTTATVNKQRYVVTDEELLTLVKLDAEVNTERIALCATEAVNIAVSAASINASRVATSQTQSLALADNDSVVNATRAVTTTEQQLTLTDSDSAINPTRKVTTATQPLTINESQATVVTTENNLSVICTTETLDITNTSAIVYMQRIVATTAEVTIISDGDATINATRDVATATEQLTLTNTNATVDAARNVTTVTEQLTLADTDAAINTARGVTATTEQLALTDTDATVTRPNHTTTVTEQLDITVTNASLNATLVLAANIELLDITASNAQVFQGQNLDVNGATEALDIAVTTASINATLVIVATTETLQLGNTNASATLDLAVSGVTETLTLTDSDAAIDLARGVTTVTEQLTLTNTNATLGAARDVTALTEQLALANTNATLDASRVVTGVTKTLALANTSASINRALSFTTLTEQLVIDETIAQVYRGANLTVSCGTETLTIATSNASVQADLAISASTETLQITPTAATVVRGTQITATTESLALTNTSATVNTTRTAATATELLEITASAADVFKGANLDITATTESLVLTDNDASIAFSRTVVGLTEALVITSNGSIVLRPQTVVGLTEELELTTAIAAVTKRFSGTMPGSMVYARPGVESYIFIDNRFIQI